MFLISRGVQGVGGGGIIQLMLITIGDIVELEERAKYAGLMGQVIHTSSFISISFCIGLSGALLLFSALLLVRRSTFERAILLKSFLLRWGIHRPSFMEMGILDSKWTHP